MGIFNSTASTVRHPMVLSVTPSVAVVESLVFTHVPGAEHAAPVEPQTHCPPEQTLESVPQSASAVH